MKYQRIKVLVRGNDPDGLSDTKGETSVFL